MAVRSSWMLKTTKPATGFFIISTIRKVQGQGNEWLKTPSLEPRNKYVEKGQKAQNSERITKVPCTNKKSIENWGLRKCSSSTNFSYLQRRWVRRKSRKTRNARNAREKKLKKMRKKRKKVAKFFTKNSTLFREKHARAKLEGHKSYAR